MSKITPASDYHSQLSKKETFKTIIDSLSDKRKIIFECILLNFPVTDKKISELTGLPINIVTPRRKELQGFRWEKPGKGMKSRYIHHPELEYIEFHSYENEASICKWKPTDKAVTDSPEIIFS